MTEPRNSALESEGSFARLVDWALGENPLDLPLKVQRRAALLVADNLTALLAAVGDPGVSRAQTALREGGAERAVSPRVEAMDMAIALSWMELDEGYSRASCHAGLYSLPVISALAARSGASVRTVLGQIALTYEVLARLAAAYPARRFTWHPHAMWSPVGAAMARCRADEVPAEIAVRSLRIASTLSMTGGYEAAVDGAEVRNVWAAMGIGQGFASVDLALAGLDGPQGAPEAIFARLTGRDLWDGDLLARGLGRDWAIFDSFTKRHACCQSTHSAIAAALILRQAEGFALEAIERIEVATPRAEMANSRPTNRLAAQFSLPHAVAATLVLGSADAEAFAPERIDDPHIARLRQATTLVTWPAPLATANARPATVRLRLKGGAVVEQTHLDAAEMDLGERQAVIRERAKSYAGKASPSALEACHALFEAQPATLDQPWRNFAKSWFGH